MRATAECLSSESLNVFAAWNYAAWFVNSRDNSFLGLYRNAKQRFFGNLPSSGSVYNWSN